MNSPDDNGLAPHEAATPAEPAKRSSMRALTKTTLALFAAVGLAIVAAGGTYAYLNSAATVSDAVTVTAGTASLSVSPSLTGMTPPTAPPTLYPGVTTYGTATITNTGDVALSVTASASAGLSALDSAVTLSVGVVADADGCAAGFAGTSAAVGGSAVTLGTSAPASTQILCVAVTLPIDAPAGSQSSDASLTFAINGTQAN